MRKKRPLGPEDHPDWGKASEPEAGWEWQGEGPEPPPEMQAAMEVTFKLHMALAEKARRLSWALAWLYIPTILANAIFLLAGTWAGTVASIACGIVVLAVAIKLRHLANLIIYMPMLAMVRREED